MTYRELHRIDTDLFLSDLLALPLFTAPATSATDLVAQYNDGLSALLDTHAPVRTKIVNIRPANPWLTEEVLAGS